MNQMWDLNGAAGVLPFELRQALDRLDRRWAERTEELRLRRGYPMMVGVGDRELETDSLPITEAHLLTVLENASQASVHTVLGQIREGFVTLRGGHRIGLCGTVVCREGENVTMRNLSSLSVRVARQVKGFGHTVLPALMEDGCFQSTLILSPPGVGKTTLLRDLVRELSDKGTRIAVTDERGEIAALWRGEAQLDVGRHTDVLDGCSKDEGMIMMLRGMNPQVIAVDEITRQRDVKAVSEVFGCGVSLLATAHGRRIEDLKGRRIYRTLMDLGMFRRVVIMERQGDCRRMTVEVLG